MAVGMATSVIKVFVMAKSQLDVVDIDDVIRRQVQENIAKVGKVKTQQASDKSVKQENAKE